MTGEEHQDGRCGVSASRAAGLTVALLGSVLVTGPLAAQSAVSGGDGTFYVGTYAKSIYVIDEATMTVSDRIPIEIGIPLGLTLSADRKRFYVTDPAFQNVEIVDIEARRSIDRFSLNEGDKKVRIWGFNVDPQERFAVILVKTYTKLADRFEIGPPTLLRYDLETRSVTDTIPWPEGEERDGVRILFSPEGDLLYFFSQDILIYETENFTEVDRWELSQPLEEGMGRFSFGFPSNIYEDPGFYTGLFRITDPVQNRRMMGVARVNLREKSVDFYTLGPSASVSFALAPDRRKAYGLHREIGSYEFWTFDLEGRRVERKQQFRGRPRMSLMPSSNGRQLYIYNAGNTIDIYDSATYEHLRTVELDADMTSFILLPSGGSDGG